MLEYFAVPSSSCCTSSCAVDAQRLGAAVDVEAVPRLVLHLGDEAHLAPQARRARDPVPLGQHADDLGVGVLRHHPDELAPVALRHPVLGLDRLAGGDARLERGDERRIVRGDGRFLLHVAESISQNGGGLDNRRPGCYLPRMTNPDRVLDRGRRHRRPYSCATASPPCRSTTPRAIRSPAPCSRGSPAKSRRSGANPRRPRDRAAQRRRRPVLRGRIVRRACGDRDARGRQGVLQRVLARDPRDDPRAAVRARARAGQGGRAAAWASSRPRTTASP